MLEQIFDCGGPPQAYGSGRGEQHYEACIVCAAVEIMAELIEIGRSESG